MLLDQASFEGLANTRWSISKLTPVALAGAFTSFSHRAHKMASLRASGIREREP